MRFSDFKVVLTESGLPKSYLQKYRGKYLDMLINMIATGKDVELEGDSKSRYGKTVKIDPSEAKRLAQMFYGKDSPIEDKSETNADDRGFLIPAQSLPSSIQIKLKGRKETIPTGDIYKTSEMKGSKKPFNSGDVGEAFLGAACTAKFEKLGEEITEEDVLSVLKRLTVIEQGKNKRGTLSSTANNDTIEYVLVLNQTSFGALYQSVKSGKLPPEMIGLNRSAVKWANRSAAVREAIKIAVEDEGKNTIVVNSDGVSDQKGTKADLFLNIDGNSINLISAKAGDVKQFGQVPGNSYEKVQTLFKSIFGINISDKYIEQMNGSDATHNYPIFKEVYKDVAADLANELAGNTAAEVKFIERLYNGISQHASLNDPKVSMVILKATPNSPGFTELNFGQELKSAMEQFDLQVKYQADPPVIKIYGRPIGTDAIEETKLAGNSLLIQVRTNMKGDSSKGYIRSLIEMGGLLKAIAAVEDDIVDAATDEPDATVPAAKSTPVAKAKPVAAQPEQPANDPNATI
jgi:hypothetical protein